MVPRVVRSLESGVETPYVPVVASLGDATRTPRRWLPNPQSNQLQHRRK
ncbi:MAG: hypothetical protein RMY30_027415 [Nostoc sp. CmiSLP01]|nr:hypothetical protein [Nostoc sp. ChiSLP01]